MEAQQKDIEVDKVKENIKPGIETLFRVLDDEMVLMGKRMYLPGDQVLKGELLKEAHETRLNIHPGSTKMYNDLKEFYWWPNMKKQITNFVASCPVCQQVKVEHQKPARPLQPLLIPQSKWEDITMDFV